MEYEFNVLYRSTKTVKVKTDKGEAHATLLAYKEALKRVEELKGSLQTLVRIKIPTQSLIK